MKIIKFNARNKKSIKIKTKLENHYANNRILIDNNENRENIVITYENHENHENHKN